MAWSLQPSCHLLRDVTVQRLHSLPGTVWSAICKNELSQTAGKVASEFPSHFEWKVSVNTRMEGMTWAQAENPAFSVQRDGFPVHFVIHFRCITKQHSLSSFRCPIGRGSAREEPWVEIKAKIKAKPNQGTCAEFSTSRLRSQNGNGWQRRWHFTTQVSHLLWWSSNSISFSSKRCRISNSRLNRHICRTINTVAEHHWWSIHSTTHSKSFTAPFSYILSRKQLKCARFFV